MATVQIRRQDIGESRDIQSLLSRLREKYSGKWVMILQNGDIVADEKLETLYTIASKKKSNIAAMFQAPKKGQLFLK